MSKGSFLVGAATTVVLLCASCVDAVPPQSASASASRGPGRALQPYAGRATTLFDDDIEPMALGYALGGGSRPEDAGLLRERTRLGDRVVRARVVTVTSNHAGEVPTLRIGLHSIESLVGLGERDVDFTLDVAGSARGAGILTDSQSRLVGLTVIAFVREFADQGDESQVHFHLARDDKDEADAVRVASVAAEMGQGQ
jgi:hypothetical protein